MRKKLILLHGAPASGKLTIGEQIHVQSGIFLYHNHISLENAKKKFEYGTSEFSNYVWNERLQFLKLGFQKEKNIVFTWAFCVEKHKNQLNDIRNTCELLNVFIMPIYLYCPIHVRFERVSTKSRKAYGKISSTEHLEEVENQNNYLPIEDINTLCFSTEDDSPKKIARKILKGIREKDSGDGKKK